jgi:spermidine synthase
LASPDDSTAVGGSGCGIVALVVVLVVAPAWDRTLLGAGVYIEPRTFIDGAGNVSVSGVVADYHLTTYTEGYNETIMSFETPKGIFIAVNGSPAASDQYEDMLAHRMLGHLPMLFHPGPVKTACVVGLGAGVTAGAMALYDVERVTAIELEKGVLVASRFFGDYNDRVLDNPRLDLRIDDGRNFFRLSREKFDVIGSHANFPSQAGSGALFSREFLEQCKAHLAPGGVMCHWAPLWRTRPEDWKTAVGTFVDVFPYVRVFNAGLTTVLLGRMEPFPPVDVAELNALRAERSGAQPARRRHSRAARGALGLPIRRDRSAPDDGGSHSHERRSPADRVLVPPGRL